ncbi:hypothetical protein [Sphaerochaeta halotolerans]|jgi:hypothetical protein|uniref:Uncharacterized protein n=1 Tax=Sphaerochaeta halotolerans TaxID=2293840 RepID=A0A372MIH2_9SPIR|nr:hypothetical protein [Sphaerochaeta halotolerans]MBG0767299.1 hypothetical protein [Spirochaetaceae bacterium]MDK2859516.1 hypothetical protein [Sphaerochaeta sp.]MDN5334248.1 hypothetical protein [Sphaerochaeta sp.]MXI87058.1 hypothetical protein [Sphaerochaeta halotolerans]RFU95582.1 hypothetical protein DYP60_03660 [Sphaerochaeta halotolerans]
MERANAVIGEVVCATTTVLGELSDRCHIYGDKYTTHVLTVTEKLPRVLRKGMGVLFLDSKGLVINTHSQQEALLR